MKQGKIMYAYGKQSVHRYDVGKQRQRHIVYMKHTNFKLSWPKKKKKGSPVLSLGTIAPTQLTQLSNIPHY
jgi:hypothetical protein